MESSWDKSWKRKCEESGDEGFSSWQRDLLDSKQKRGKRKNLILVRNAEKCNRINIDPLVFC